MRVDVVPTADAVAPGSLGGGTVLVVDVLRASTTMIVALANGCVAIRPVAGTAEARRLAGAHGGNGALAAGERHGEAVAGFDLGNSPLEFTEDRVRGKTVFFTTSNGTRALLAARGAAALVNLTAAAAWAAGAARDVVVLCAGARGAPSLEDQVCAGLLVERIGAAVPRAVLTAAAREAAAESRPYAGDVTRLGADSPWARRLAAAGRRGDVAACLRLDTTTLVPVYLPGVDKVVAGRG